MEVIDGTARRFSAYGSRILGSWLMRTFPTYDIVKKEHNNFVWVDAAHDIQSAKKRVYELSRESDAEFVIFNEHTLQVVATLGKSRCEYTVFDQRQQQVAARVGQG
jgi:hypothetical protein